MNLAVRLAGAGILVAAGYLSGRAAASFALDRRAPIDLRALADDIERRQWRTGLPRPRRSAFESLTSSRST